MSWVKLLLENPIGLIVVLTIFALYLPGMVWSRRTDKKDVQKAGIGILPGHVLNTRKDCQYIITVYTGYGTNAGTTAEVKIALNSLYEEATPFTLRDQTRFLFEKGGVDAFLVSTEQPIGGLTHVRVWHDSGGHSPGWFLRQIVVTNRGTGETSYFLCNRWLAADEDDGKVHRVLPKATPDEMTNSRNLFLAKSARDMNDDHVWFSVLGRPARSPFTRAQRLSCCLTLLYSTMFTNIMFFGRGDDFDPPAPIRFAGLVIKSPVSLAQNPAPDHEPPSMEARLTEQREKRRRREVVVEVLVFWLFFTVLMMTSYMERSPLAYHMTQHEQNVILDGGDVTEVSRMLVNMARTVAVVTSPL
ncbi:PREDICTED: polycystic kidney disease protein 1-like 3 [Branchiostoma belcheri]|uniref:Polycystic kidney disease protein 1-like 3 n=1 Tax=Branchiostoma belcheri TaxID=7741 RepID=A0A6P4Z455_BRABE|nr:PREDICTED: polycystic kidney disease protein 1-like 3 [Branchiostoma belcheri]